MGIFNTKAIRFITGTTALLMLTSCAGIKEVKNFSPKQAIDEKQQIIKKELELSPSVVQVKIPKDAFVIKGLHDFDDGGRTVTVEFSNAKFDAVLAGIARTLKLNVVYDTVNTGATAPAQSQSSSMLSVSQPQTPPAIQPQVQPGLPNPGSVPAMSLPATSTRPDASRPRQESASSGGSGPMNVYTARLTLNYSGRLKNLLEIVSKKTGYFFSLENDTVIVKNEDIFNVVVPSHADLMDEIRGNFERLGAKDIGYDNLSSTVTFRADYGSVKRIGDYLATLKSNAAAVTMRLILLNVKLNSDKNLGIDWSQFVYGYGAQKQDPFGFAAISNNSSSSGGTGGTGGTGTTTTTTERLFDAGLGVLMNSTGANVFIEQRKFTAALFANFIEQHGSFSIMQNVFIDTLSGKGGKIEVVREIPYVANIGVAAVSAGGQATNATQGTAQTATAKAGVTMEVYPLYSKANETIGVKLEVGVYGVTRLINLSAGNLGVLTQPETTKRTIKAHLRMRPDQIAVLGGLVHEQETADTSGLPLDTLLTKKLSKTTEKEELILLVKPTVVEFVSN